jgi:hypothetical protein
MPHGFDILFASLVCGLGLIGTGVGLAFCRSRAGKIKSLIGGVVFIFAVTGTFSIYALTYELIAASTLLVSAALVWFIRSPAAAHIGRWLLRPRVAGVATSVVGVGLIALCAHRIDFDRNTEDERFLALLEQSSSWHPPLEPASVECLTDGGTPVRVYSASVQRTRDEIVQEEKTILAGFDWEHRVIHRRPADDVSNCHGWVFTGGKYWVLGSDVITIVEQNGYRPVRIPRPGDLVVYHRADGIVSHTGIVRSVGAVTMVESKWGWMGVYLHAVESSCYGTKFTFYHNPTRSGHQFAQLNPSDAVPPTRFTRTMGPNRRTENR